MSDQQARFIARAAAVRRIDALFHAMRTDFLLREQFVTGPIEILTEYLGGTPVPPEQAAITNRLIYSVFASKELLRWLQEYAHERMDDVPETDRFLADFCRAAVDHRGYAVVAALLAGCAADSGIRGLTDDLLHYFMNLHTAQVLSGEEVAVGEDGEAVGDGAGEADHDRIAVVREDEARGTLTAVTWTTYTTGTGTGTGTGVATRSPITAVQMRAENRELRVGPFMPRYVADTLNALARYAAQLADRGALDYR